MAKKRRNEIVAIGRQCRERFLLPTSSGPLRFLWERGVRTCGASVLQGKYHIRRKNRVNHQILYTLAGSAWFRTAGLETITRPGQLWIIPEGSDQEYGLHGSSWEMLWFVLVDQMPWRVIKDIGVCVRESVLGKKLQALASQLMWEVQAEDRYADRVVQFLSETILVYLQREFDLQHEPNNYRISNKLLELFDNVRSRLRNDWSVKKLADESGLFISPDHFNRLCVRHLGSPPMRIVTRLRLERAAELLWSTDYSMKTISRLVGYESYFAFATAFKRRHGCTPSQLRKSTSQRSE